MISLCHMGWTSGPFPPELLYFMLCVSCVKAKSELSCWRKNKDITRNEKLSLPLATRLLSFVKNSYRKSTVSCCRVTWFESCAAVMDPAQTNSVWKMFVLLIQPHLTDSTQEAPFFSKDVFFYSNKLKWNNFTHLLRKCMKVKIFKKKWKVQ